MKYFFRYLLGFAKVPGFAASRIYNYFALKAFGVKYKTYPVISGRIMIKGSGQFFIGKDVTINSSLNSNPVGLCTKTVLFAYPGSVIKLGDRVGVSTSLLCAMQEIVVEDDVRLGGGTQVFDNDFHSIRFADRMQNPDTNIRIKPVLIKKGAFIGCNSIIGKGVVIGERSIVAAGSVVTKSIPDDEIWGGNPAVFIKKINNVL